MSYFKTLFIPTLKNYFWKSSTSKKNVNYKQIDSFRNKNDSKMHN